MTPVRSSARRKNVRSSAVFRPRLSELRRRLRKWKASALLISNPRDIRYLTGFVGDDSWALVQAGSATVHVLSDSRFEEQIQQEAPQVKALMREKSLAEALGKLRKKLRFTRLAVQADYLTLAERSRLASHVGGKSIIEIDDGLIRQRAIKDQGELACIQKAHAIQVQAFQSVLKSLRPGQTEYQIAAQLEYQMRLLGADGPSFPSIVAAGANSSLPHAIPGPAKIRRGGIILFDWGARVQGYCSDLTRVVALGRMPAKIREIYAIVLEAQLAGIAAVAPGKKLADVDAAARNVIKKAGYGDHFGHGLGHGIGLDIHEQPNLSSRAQGELQPGQVVTVEPGIYLPGVGGVRIEDDVVVTRRGGQVLGHLPKDLKSAII